MLDFEKALAMLKKSFVVLSLSLALATHAPLEAQVRLGSEVDQDRLARRGVLFGITLSQKARQISEKVDRLYGMPARQIRSEAPSALESSSNALVDIEGRPVIEIRTASEVREDVIVHELHHLILTAEGRPVVSFVPDDSLEMGEFQGLLFSIISMQLVSPVDHAAFYPKMRELGYDPDVETRAYWTETMKNPLPPSLKSIRPGVAFYSCLYFELLLTVRAEELRRDVKVYLQNNGLGEAVARGERIAAIYAEGRKSPSRLWLPMIVKILNEAFVDYFVFSVLHDGTGARGKIKYHSAVLRVANHPARLKNGLKSPS